MLTKIVTWESGSLVCQKTKLYATPKKTYIIKQAFAIIVQILCAYSLHRHLNNH
jgi:hypothetical protein